MKVVDIAAKNRVSSEHVMEICKDLGISYENDNSDISDNDVFLVGKKIEVIKEKRATETLELIEKKTGKADKDKNQKKIKLKRKVHISRGVVKHPNNLPDKSKDEKKEIKDNKDLKDDKKQEIKPVIKQEIKQEKEKVPHN